MCMEGRKEYVDFIVTSDETEIRMDNKKMLILFECFRSQCFSFSFFNLVLSDLLKRKIIFVFRCHKKPTTKMAMGRGVRIFHTPGTRILLSHTFVFSIYLHSLILLTQSLLSIYLSFYTLPSCLATYCLSILTCKLYR